jgi:hypothetical protein
MAVKIRIREPNAGSGFGVNRSRHARVPFFLHLPFNLVHYPLQEPPGTGLRSDACVSTGRIEAMTAAMDTAVGAVLDKLDRLGLAAITPRWKVVQMRRSSWPTIKEEIEGRPRWPGIRTVLLENYRWSEAKLAAPKKRELFDLEKR